MENFLLVAFVFVMLLFIIIRSKKSELNDHKHLKEREVMPNSKLREIDLKWSKFAEVDFEKAVACYSKEYKVSLKCSRDVIVGLMKGNGADEGS